MKKKIQKYLAGEREGFSLVELIIVIAIMAILIGVIALAVIPNIKKSRESKDLQVLDNVLAAANQAVANAKIDVPSTETITKDFGETDGTVTCSADSGNTDKGFKKAFEEAMSGTLAFGSGAATKSGNHLYVILENKKITVKIATGGTANPAKCDVTLNDTGSAEQPFIVTN